MTAKIGNAWIVCIDTTGEGEPTAIGPYKNRLIARANVPWLRLAQRVGRTKHRPIQIVVLKLWEGTNNRCVP